MHLSLAEKVEIVRLVGDNARNCREAAQEFNRRHPNRFISHSTVSKVNQMFNQRGSVVREKVKRPRNHPQDERILNHFRLNPKSSLRSFDVRRKSSASRCLKRNGIKPFKPRFLHTLQPGDDERRMEYCLTMQAKFYEDNGIFGKILFTDEATFSTNGTVSSQNIRFWSEDNPHWVINCKSQYSARINVWCGVLKDRIIGPFFFNTTLNGVRFLEFLQHDFWDAIHGLPLEYRENLYVQLDGAPIHNFGPVRGWLNENFENKWIGRNSPFVAWPPRAPDLTPLDFYLWGTIKNKVYKTRPASLQALKDRIRNACAEISRQEIRKVCLRVRKIYEKCIRNYGGLVEDTDF